MKKILSFVLFAAAVIGLSSCNKEEAGSRLASEGAPIRLEIQVAGSGEAVATRATGIVSNDENSEAKVNSLQVFVFNGNALDGYASANGKSVAVSCTSGQRDIYAVVNAPSLASVTSKSALLASVSRLAEEVSNFQMIGSKTETLQYDGTVTINVDRLAARVVIRGIKNALQNAAQAADFKLLAVYLTNVAAVTRAPTTLVPSPMTPSRPQARLLPQVRLIPTPISSTACLMATPLPPAVRSLPVQPALSSRPRLPVPCTTIP